MVHLILGWLLGAGIAESPPRLPVTAATLASLVPEANRDAIALAVSAMRCAQGSGLGIGATRLAFIDYSRPSTEPRLWVFDVALGKLLYEEVVAHGRGSGENIARFFSNVEGSHASSLGLFLTRETYQGRNGYSLRMDGLEPGVNDAAMERAIVMHGAPYVDPRQAERQGRLGRSFGCPAVREAVARGVIDVLKDGQFVFAYYPDAQWLSRTRWQCAG
jgi:hypothetical protein